MRYINKDRLNAIYEDVLGHASDEPEAYVYGGLPPRMVLSVLTVAGVLLSDFGPNGLYDRLAEALSGMDEDHVTANELAGKLVEAGTMVGFNGKAVAAIAEHVSHMHPITRAEYAARMILSTNGGIFGARVLSRTTGRVRTFNARIGADALPVYHNDGRADLVVQDTNATRRSRADGDDDAVAYRTIALENVLSLTFRGRTADFDLMFGPLTGFVGLGLFRPEDQPYLDALIGA